MQFPEVAGFDLVLQQHFSVKVDLGGLWCTALILLLLLSAMTFTEIEPGKRDFERVVDDAEERFLRKVCSK